METRRVRGAGIVVCLLGGLAADASFAADITVSAAASLTNAFNEIGQAYERTTHGRHRVLFNFGASGSLLQQIARGAPVDVFASADLETMDRAQKQNLIYPDSRENFVANRLVVIAPGRSPLSLSLSRLSELNVEGVQRIAVGIPESVPVGRYAKDVLMAAGLWDVLQPRMVFAQSVRQCLDYVARGEVDAGFVYATDALLMKQRVKTVLEVKTDKPILYPIAVVKGNGQEDHARAFVRFVRSDGTRKILARHGFLEPLVSGPYRHRSCACRLRDNAAPRLDAMDLRAHVRSGRRSAVAHSQGRRFRHIGGTGGGCCAGLCAGALSLSRA